MTHNYFGLEEESYYIIIDALSDYDFIDDILVFGSRAMGNEKTGSDIDLALVGEDIQYEDVLNISSLLNEEAPIPYYVDVVHYDSLSNKDLKDQIINEGQALLKYEHLRSFK